MADIKIHITNLKEIQAAFRHSPVEMTKNLRIAIERTVSNIGRDSRRYTPVRTGRLRSSHYERFYSDLRGELGTNTLYDRFVHDGTRFMRARPYLQTAVDMNESFIDTEFRNAVQNTLDSIARSAP